MLKPLIYKKEFSLTSGEVLQGEKRTIDAPFLLEKLVSFQTGIFSARLNLDGRPMSRRNIINTNQFGISTFPYVLTAPGYVPYNSDITIDITDLSLAGNTVKLIFIGLTGTEKELSDLTDSFLNFPYFYSDEITIAGSDEDKLIIKTDVDHTFRIIQLMSTQTGIFDAEIKVNNNSINRGRMPNSTLFGTAQLPLIIDPYDTGIKGRQGGIIEFDLLDTSTSSNIIRPTLGGHKVTR